MNNTNFSRKFKKMPLFVAVLGCLYGPAALAQAQDAETEDKPKQSTVDLDKVTVTGSLIKRVEYESTSPVQVISADTSVTVGQTDTASFLQQSSVAAGSTQFSHQFSGFVIEGGTGVQTVSLRGLGANRTLVLLNGNRPGPAGTRGQVGAFDLNVIPSTILQRAEIVKDGSSSIYGSDAVAGVVNLITRKSVDEPELSVTFHAPLKSGGERYSISGATGWNFDNGNIVLAGEWYRHESMKMADRDFFSCAQDYIYDADGNRIDREDRSVIGDTELGGCSAGNLYANTVMDLLTGARYVPSPDGSTVGLIPGYRPRANGTYANGGQAYYEDQLNFDFWAKHQDAISEQERKSVYLATDFSIGDLNWTTEWLFNNRTTKARGTRQFFPVIGGATSPLAAYRYANDPDYVAMVPSGIAQVVMPMLMDQQVDVDYFYVNSALDGFLPFGDWSWRVNASYSKSKGEYRGLSISASRSGDVTYSDDAPTLDYFDPGFLNGSRINELVDAIGVWDVGHTTYEQFIVNGTVTGELFQLPAGGVGAAFGVEYRDHSIDDQPGPLSASGDLWGQSSATPTVGEDKVKEIFAEIEVPLLKGLPGIESLTWNVSGRMFDYDSVDDSDYVWKTGLGWQIVPSLRARATKGTSYRAPGLYELYLGDQSGFQPQLAVDPCIQWSDSSNENVRRNCAAAGIPGDYAGNPASAIVYESGGAGFLKPETSEAFTAGLIWTPEFAPLSVALDYFEYTVRDQIGTLGPGSIVGGCYGANNYPNNFCSMLERNPATHPTDPNKIETIYATFVNINQQKVRGYDLLARYEDDFSFGSLDLEAQVTYTYEDVVNLFDPDVADGFDLDDNNGDIGRPKLVGDFRAALTRGDFTYTWFMNYVDSTKALGYDEEHTYFGHVGAIRDLTAESRLYHTASVLFDQPKWSVLFGVRNLFDKEPPVISSGMSTISRYGNVPAFASQYDWYGRTVYARFNYKF